MEKIEKAAVLYFPAQDIDSAAGAKCGNCSQFEEPESCKEVAGKILAAGVCGLFAPKGQKISQRVAGYIDEGSTHCGSCEYFCGGKNPRGPCRIVEGFVEFEGCCDAYERK